MAERPKGYLSKGKTKSPDAARKAKARETFTPKGLGKEVLNAVLSGSPMGRSAKATVLGIKSGRTTGNVKAILRANDKYGESKITKGKNSKLLAKSNKKTVIAEANKYGVSLGRVPASKTRKLKIGNTRTASPTSKGFSSGTKPVPVKKKSK